MIGKSDPVPGGKCFHRVARFRGLKVRTCLFAKRRQKLTPDQYEKNFADISPPINARQASIEASRCLYCFDAPCTIACPTRIDVLASSSAS